MSQENNGNNQNASNDWWDFDSDPPTLDKNSDIQDNLPQVESYTEQSQQQKNCSESEGKQPRPFRVYFFAALIYAVISTVLRMVARIHLDGLLTFLLVGFSFLFSTALFDNRK